jgi:hypothetical protein
VLIRPEREFERPAPAELAPHAGQELGDDLGVHLRLDVEPAAALKWAARIGHVDRGEPQALRGRLR